LITLTQLSQKGIRVDPGIVTVTPCKLQRISPDGRNILQHDEERDIVRLKSALARPFIDTGRTRTVLAEVAHRVDALVAVTPFDA
jgi:hypothetical protein